MFLCTFFWRNLQCVAGTGASHKTVGYTKRTISPSWCDFNPFNSPLSPPHCAQINLWRCWWSERSLSSSLSLLPSRNLPLFSIMLEIKCVTDQYFTSAWKCVQCLLFSPVKNIPQLHFIRMLCLPLLKFVITASVWAAVPRILPISQPRSRLSWSLRHFWLQGADRWRRAWLHVVFRCTCCTSAWRAFTVTQSTLVGSRRSAVASPGWQRRPGCPSERRF